MPSPERRADLRDGLREDGGGSLAGLRWKGWRKFGRACCAEQQVVVALDTLTVTRSGQPVRLTHLAFKLLSFFCRSASRVYSREQLLREVWGIRQARRAC